MLKNYFILQQLWDSVLDDDLDSDVRARVLGVKAQMETFDYFLVYLLVKKCLITAIIYWLLCRPAQSQQLNEGQRVASLTVTTLAKIRTDEYFTMLWNLVQKKAAAVNVCEPSLPRR